MCEGKYRRAWNQFNKADKLNSDKRSRHGIKKAKKLEDKERERKWDEEYGKEYAMSILENGQYWDKLVNGQSKLKDLVLSYLLNRNPQLLIPCFPGEKPGAHEEVITPLNAR